jgi:hypothetical protein
MPTAEEMTGAADTLVAALRSMCQVEATDPAYGHLRDEARLFSDRIFTQVWEIAALTRPVRVPINLSDEEFYRELLGAAKLADALVGRGVRLPAPLIHQIVAKVMGA